MSKKKISLFHFPSHICLNIFGCLLGAALVSGALELNQIPALAGVSMVLLATVCVMRSLTSKYFWDVHHYLGDYMQPLVEKTRAEGNVLRISINDAVVFRFVLLLNSAVCAAIALNFTAHVYFYNAPNAVAFGFWGGVVLYTASFYLIRNHVAKRILRAGWVAKARPMGNS